MSKLQYLPIYTMYTVQYTGSIGSHHLQDAFPIGLSVCTLYTVQCTVQTLSPLPYRADATVYVWC